MSNEELLKQRYKVISDYPKSIYPVGTIIDAGWRSEDLLYCDHDGPRMRDFPHLFKKLEWWEERDEKDMPEYVRVNKGNKVYRVESFTQGNSPFTGFAKLSNNKGEWSWDRLSPATKEEYEQQLQLNTVL